MPYVRVTRDERGYENTFLLHVRWPGDPPQVLYWFRTAPGVRVGRHPLDEAAIRAIEEQHPEIAFDWDHLIEASTMLPPEVERRPERPRRKPRAPEVESPREGLQPESSRRAGPPAPFKEEDVESQPVQTVAEPSGTDARPESELLDQLVGREIAARLRARHAELVARIVEMTDAERRAELQTRADALDPDSWQTPEAILDGMQHADQRFEELRRDVSS